MKRLLPFFLFLFPGFIYAQIDINKTKAVIKTELSNFKNENATYKVIFSETDSTFSVTKTDIKKNKSNYFFQFDKTKACKLIKSTYSCEACFKEELEKVLSLEKYGWKKINENQFVSKFEENIMIELLPESNEKTIIIIRMEWSKILYDLLLGN